MVKSWSLTPRHRNRVRWRRSDLRKCEKPRTEWLPIVWRGRNTVQKWRNCRQKHGLIWQRRNSPIITKVPRFTRSYGYPSRRYWRHPNNPLPVHPFRSARSTGDWNPTPFSYRRPCGDQADTCTPGEKSGIKRINLLPERRASAVCRGRVKTRRGPHSRLVGKGMPNLCEQYSGNNR